MDVHDLFTLANAAKCPNGACPYAWWIAPFLVESSPGKPEMPTHRKDEEQLDLFLEYEQSGKAT